MSSLSLLEALPPVQRLALAYAPARAREPTLALLALDTRLAGIVRNSHEPSLAQLRLAWWREQLRVPAAEWPRGEPLLMALRSWQGRHVALAALVDGWEYLTGAAPLPDADMLAFAAGRGEAFAALADVVGAGHEAAARLGRRWALADLAANVSNAQERQVAARLLAAEARPPRVARALRPLAVLHGLALRRPGSAPTLTVLAALRLGLLGR
ncbi:MAG: squalene/phytoene synthase family protein [Novosphingobium sp.]